MIHPESVFYNKVLSYISSCQFFPIQPHAIISFRVFIPVIGAKQKWVLCFPGKSKGFNLNTTLNFFPSLSVADRIRVDYILDIKYDLPLDFYVKLGFQFNYDNQPPELASGFDYLLNTGVGWKFN